jgi:hypothetical protein
VAPGGHGSTCNVNTTQRVRVVTDLARPRTTEECPAGVAALRCASGRLDVGLGDRLQGVRDRLSAVAGMLPLSLWIPARFSGRLLRFTYLALQMLGLV